MQAVQFDDRYGPMVLCGGVVTALCAIFLISCIDFYELMHEQHATPPLPSPSPAPAVQHAGLVYTFIKNAMRAR